MTQKIAQNPQTKVVAINGSPHKDKGNTALILNPFLEGMKDAGADVALYYTEDLTIHPCRGDLSCWLRTHGQCILQDDMTRLLPQIQESDILVMASPVYYWGLTGPLKVLLDRLFPGFPRDPLSSRTRSLVLVSNCGQWEMEMFDPLLAQMQAWCSHDDLIFAGALLRPHGPVFKEMIKRGLPVHDVTTAASTAGRQLIRDGKISQDVLNTVSRPLIPRDCFRELLAQAGLRR